MNRTNLCIRMLQLLKARGKMNTAQLAQELEVNPRNIREFKKELVLAGLNDSFDLPVFMFTDEEKSALLQSYQFMQGQKDFKSLNAYCSAMDKIVCSYKIQNEDSPFYLTNENVEMDKKISNMIDTTQQAIHLQRCVLLSYQSLKDEKPKEFLVEPYEIIYYRKAYYLIGFSLLRNDYRMYRFSNQRMFQCQLNSRLFIRDTHFKLSNYIGENSLIPNDFQQICLRVYKKNNALILFKERYWGSQMELQEKTQDYVDYTFYTDDVYRLYRNVFSMKNLVKILSPQKVQEEYITNVKSILENY